MRPVDSWNGLVTTFDVTRLYRLASGIPEVDLPLPTGGGRYCSSSGARATGHRQILRRA
jgi:hypothetical protein